MMRRSLLLAVLLSCFGLGAWAGENVRHELEVELDPISHELIVRDTIVLPESLAARAEGVEFLLNASLKVEQSDPPLEVVAEVGEGEALAVNGAGSERTSAAALTRYRPVLIPEDRTLTVLYRGPFDFGLSDQKEEYTRGFRDTVGIVGEEGVYLAASSFWYPFFGDELIEFAVEVTQPDGWQVISEGKGTARGEDGRARWQSEGPADEIFLTGGPLVVYSETAGAVEALVYLREPDDGLANKYLIATAQYLEMYRDLIGPYPYSKFALVENFWETGYGMPSFTLLGPRVIRFPFILHSSYPHEILHNWWGNGVFVDYASGNWCEGLTAYMADHLIQEQRGKGQNYRRDTLQKYRNYVKDERDFPLEEFRSRHSAATEAVGYGKSLMGFHMIRRQLGDENFRLALARFYRQKRGHQASFRDLQKSFETTAEIELGAFFDQWLQRPGAPSFTVTVDRVGREGDGYVVEATLDQVQAGQPFSARVPVVLDTLAGRVSKTIEVSEARTPFTMRVPVEPRLLRVDPQFDVFRMLDPRETPPSIGQLFGEGQILALLPSAAAQDVQQRYRDLLDGWQSDVHSIEIKLDSDVAQIPSDRAAWILGGDNLHVGSLFADGSVVGLEIDDRRIDLAGEQAMLGTQSIVAVRRHPENVEKAVGWLVVDPPGAFPGMGRKLPHYGKYSYLAFEGDGPDNVIKGQWAATDSPLTVDLRPENESGQAVAVAAFKPRPALAELPPVFSERALAEHVSYLASPDLQGRGVGGEGLAQAASYIEKRFQEIGLSPGGTDGTYRQPFVIAEGPDGKPVEVVNLIGYIPGQREDWRDQSVIVSAHYDHLGLGWPDVHSGDEGKVHPGADDNASGVAVLLELAKNFADGDPPSRNLVFIAFSGEEAGRLGSIHFVEHPAIFPLDGIRGAINVDTVGRLGEGRITVLATGTADEWQHIFRGVGFVTGIDSRNVPQSLDASDQVSFIEKGIPAVQIFTEAHADYHRPTDTADKVDMAGLVRIATFVKEATAYLVEREEPLTVTIAAAEGEGKARAKAPASGRKVSFGTVPEFAFQGPGVQVSSLVPGSPAEKAGIQAGDVLTRIDDREVEDLRGFSDILKTLEPGQTIKATVVRGGEELQVEVTVTTR